MWFPHPSVPWCGLLSILLLLCKICPISSQVRPVVLQASPPIMSEAAQSQLFLTLFTDTQNLHWKPFCSVCLQTWPILLPVPSTHSVCLKAQPCKANSSLAAAQGKSTHPHPLLQVHLPSQCSQQPGTSFPARVHEELGYFLWALVYSTFQTFRQHSARVVLRAYQTTVQWSVSPKICLSPTRADTV